MMKRKPTTPGEILLEEFLKPTGLTSQTFSSFLDPETIDCIVRGEQRVTPKITEKLGTACNTTADFWLNAQATVDRWTNSKIS